MKQNACSNAGARGEQIVSYLYDESPSDERVNFERHLSSCLLCRSELDALRGVRADLGQWVPPEPDFAVTVEGPPKIVPLPITPAPVPASRQIPPWAQAVAAALVVGISAGAANLDVHYSPTQGLSVRTGWRHTAETPVVTSAVAAPAVAAEQTPWISDLVALEKRLRREIAAQPVAAPLSPTVSDDAALRRVRILLNNSEQRQKRELALRFAEMARAVEFQRQSDLAKIDRNLGIIQSRTGMEVMRTQQQVNSLAQRVSQRP